MLPGSRLYASVEQLLSSVRASLSLGWRSRARCFLRSQGLTGGPRGVFPCIRAPASLVPATRFCWRDFHSRTTSGWALAAYQVNYDFYSHGCSGFPSLTFADVAWHTIVCRRRNCRSNPAPCSRRNLAFRSHFVGGLHQALAKIASQRRKPEGCGLSSRYRTWTPSQSARRTMWGVGRWHKALARHRCVAPLTLARTRDGRSRSGLGPAAGEKPRRRMIVIHVKSGVNRRAARRGAQSARGSKAAEDCFFRPTLRSCDRFGTRFRANSRPGRGDRAGLSLRRPALRHPFHNARRADSSTQSLPISPRNGAHGARASSRGRRPSRSWRSRYHLE